MSDEQMVPPKMDGEVWRLVSSGADREAHAIEIVDGTPRVCVWLPHHRRWSSEEPIYALAPLAAYTAHLRALLAARPSGIAAADRLAFALPLMSTALDMAAGGDPAAKVGFACIVRHADGSGCVTGDFEAREFIADAEAALALLAAPLPESLAAIEARAEAATREADDNECHDAEPSAYCHPCAQTALAALAADVPTLLRGYRVQAAAIVGKDAEIAALRAQLATRAPTRQAPEHGNTREDEEPQREPLR